MDIPSALSGPTEPGGFPYVRSVVWMGVPQSLYTKSLVETSGEKQCRRKFGHWRYLLKGVLGPCPFLVFSGFAFRMLQGK